MTKEGNPVFQTEFSGLCDESGTLGTVAHQREPKGLPAPGRRSEHIEQVRLVLPRFQ